MCVIREKDPQRMGWDSNPRANFAAAGFKPDEGTYETPRANAHENKNETHELGTIWSAPPRRAPGELAQRISRS